MRFVLYLLVLYGQVGQAQDLDMAADRDMNGFFSNEVGVQGVIARTHVQGERVQIEGIRPNLDFFLNQRFAINGGYLNLVDPQGRSIISGFDIGGKLFLAGGQHVSGYESEISKVSYINRSRLYFTGGYRNRTLSADRQVAYGGFGGGIGYDFNLGFITFLPLLRHFQLGAEVFAEKITNDDGNSLHFVSASLGISISRIFSGL